MKIKRPPVAEKMKKRLRNNPDVNLVDFNIPMTNGLPTPSIKDILEDKVSEKYYLKQETVDKIIKEDKFQERLATLNEKD